MPWFCSQSMEQCLLLARGRLPAARRPQLQGLVPLQAAAGFQLLKTQVEATSIANAEFQILQFTWLKA